MSRRITDLRVILIKAPLAAPIIAPFGTVDVRHNLLVQLHLESGVSGIGEVWANFPPWGCPERVEILRRVVRPALIGETLDDPAQAAPEARQGDARPRQPDGGDRPLPAGLGRHRHRPLGRA